MADGGALEGIRVLFGSHSHVAPPCRCSGASTAKTVTLCGAMRTILLPASNAPPLAARSSSWWMAQMPCTQHPSSHRNDWIANKHNLWVSVVIGSCHCELAGAAA